MTTIIYTIGVVINVVCLLMQAKKEWKREGSFGLSVGESLMALALIAGSWPGLLVMVFAGSSDERWFRQPLFTLRSKRADVKAEEP